MPALSGSATPPDASDPQPFSVKISLIQIGGFCAVTPELPLSSEHSQPTEWTSNTLVGNGLNAHLGQEVHLIASEPQSTFLRISVKDENGAFPPALFGAFPTVFTAHLP